MSLAVGSPATTSQSPRSSVFRRKPRRCGHHVYATLAPSDTIYASVASDGAAESVTLTARWTFEDGQVIDETQQTIAPAGPAASEFHVSKPDGWPAGRYQVEILADGRSVGTKQFEVR